jgi:hypothetical protein
MPESQHDKVLKTFNSWTLTTTHCASAGFRYTGGRGPAKGNSCSSETPWVSDASVLALGGDQNSSEKSSDEDSRDIETRHIKLLHTYNESKDAAQVSSYAQVSLICTQIY